jgi:hypothetical protein
MNKGSHISLARYILNRTEGTLDFHQKAFLIGSILPDCLPSFLTTRHTVTETFDILKTELVKVIRCYHRNKGITAYYCRHLGIIMHYLADYFTFPHNIGYTGSVKEHIEYERQLAEELLIHLEMQNSFMKCQENCETVDKICEYILERHNEYLAAAYDLKTDCYYITELCSIITRQILELTLLSPVRQEVKEISRVEEKLKEQEEQRVQEEWGEQEELENPEELKVQEELEEQVVQEKRKEHKKKNMAA